MKKSLIFGLAMFLGVVSNGLAEKHNLPNGDVLYTNGGAPGTGHWMKDGEKVFEGQIQKNKWCAPTGKECNEYDYLVHVIPTKMIFSDPKNIGGCYGEFVDFIDHEAPYLLDPYYGIKRISEIVEESGATMPELKEKPGIKITVDPWGL
jgi:hypothetical protein